MRGDRRSNSEKDAIQQAWMERKQAESLQNMIGGLGQNANNPGFMQSFGSQLGNSIQGRFGMGAALASAMQSGGNSLAEAQRHGRLFEDKKMKQEKDIAQLGSDTAKYGDDRKYDSYKMSAESQYDSTNRMNDMITDFYTKNPNALRDGLLPPSLNGKGVATPTSSLTAPPSLSKTPFEPEFASAHNTTNTRKRKIRPDGSSYDSANPTGSSYGEGVFAPNDTPLQRAGKALIAAPFKYLGESALSGTAELRKGAQWLNTPRKW